MNLSVLKNRKIALYLTVYTLLILMSGVFIGKQCSYNKKQCEKSPHCQSKRFNHHEKMMDRFIKKLDLSSKQIQQLETIVENHKKFYS